MSLGPRIAVASPHTAECKLIEAWLTAAGFESHRLPNQARITEELKGRTLDLLVVDVSFAGLAINLVRARNPLAPIVVIGEPNPVAEAQATARGAVYLTRPLDRGLFACTVSMAIVESRPVRRSERKRAEVWVVVQGVPSRIIDLSREGMRLEIPRTLKVAPPPPVFDVSLPMLGVALNVRRLWTANPPQSVRPATWFGGELSNNPRRVELAWFTLVDTLSHSRTTIDVR